jgi:hypothetical protein
MTHGLSVQQFQDKPHRARHTQSHVTHARYGWVVSAVRPSCPPTDSPRVACLPARGCTSTTLPSERHHFVSCFHFMREKARFLDSRFNNRAINPAYKTECRMWNGLPDPGSLPRAQNARQRGQIWLSLVVVAGCWCCLLVRGRGVVVVGVGRFVCLLDFSLLHRLRKPSPFFVCGSCSVVATSCRLNLPSL